MQVTATNTEDRTVIAVSGEVDIATSPALDAAVITAIGEGAKHITIDLTDVSFMDSSGLGVIVRGLKRSREAEIDLDLVISNDRVLKVFSITGLDQVIKIHSALADS
jgi:anti-sigma B factor antagonist